MAAAPAAVAGPVVETTMSSVSTAAAGPVLESAMSAFGASHSGPVLESVMSARSSFSAGPVREQAMQEFFPLIPPVIDSMSASQRDTDVTFLVDVLYSVFDVEGPSPGDNLTAINLEFSTTGPAGSFSPATLQPFDARHDPTPITGLPGSAPGKPLQAVWNAFQDLPEGVFDVDLRMTVEDAGSPPNVSNIAVASAIVVTTVLPDDTGDIFARQLSRRANLARTPRDFLGNGLLIPFRRGSRDFVSNKDVELIRSSVRQILGTRATVGRNIGELQWRGNFGSKLWTLRHSNTGPFTKARAAQFVRDALANEPRVRITSVFVEPEPLSEANTLQVRVTYQVITENTPQNRVILPEFTETMALA